MITRQALSLSVSSVAAGTALVAGCGPPPTLFTSQPACPTDTTSAAPRPHTSDDGPPASGPIQQPTDPDRTTMTSGFGPRDGSMHQGIDFAGPAGTPIYSALDGVVSAAGPADGFGHWIIIDSSYHGMPVSMVYGHMESETITVDEGQTVRGGDHIADIGNAGQSSGPHLHVEFWEGGRLQGGRPVDPATTLEHADTPPDTEVSLAASTRSATCAGFGTAGAGELAAGTVPSEFEPWIRKAGSLCPGIDPPILSAQLDTENGFRHGHQAPRSPAGAQGPAQFMPDTWERWGVDADHDGTADPTSIADAVMAQGRLMCALHTELDTARADGAVDGDLVELTLAAYNAGSAAVRHYRGIPPFAETQHYVAAITEAAADYRSPYARGALTPPQDGVTDDDQVLAAARQYLGTPYAWGGGGPDGPSGGGFDCSGLTSYAVHTASAGRVSLPRTSEQQWSVGVEIPMSEAQPGDLVFGSWGSGGPGHVGVYAGNGRMVHAPTTGEAVQHSPTQEDMRARRVT